MERITNRIMKVLLILVGAYYLISLILMAFDIFKPSDKLVAMTAFVAAFAVATLLIRVSSLEDR